MLKKATAGRLFCFKNMGLSDYLYSHRRGVTTAAIIIVLLIIFPTLFSIIFASRDEISFESGFSVSNCRSIFLDQPEEEERCLSTYRVVLGNTGSNPQELVSVEMNDVPEVFRKYTGAINIVASARPPVNPEITESQQGQNLHYEIRGLEPNRLVEISITTLGLPAYERLQQLEVNVNATGTVIEASPYVTVTSRFFRNMLGVFGI